MSEIPSPTPAFVESSTVNVYNSGIDALTPSAEILNRARGDVLSFLSENNIDPQSVVFSGYDSNSAKPDGGEFDEGDGKHSHYFGTIDGMLPPLDSDDEDIAGDKNAGNPLIYALNGGTLGIYDLSQLRDMTDKGILADVNYPDSRVVDIDDHGTLALIGTPANIESAKIGELHFRNSRKETTPLDTEISEETTKDIGGLMLGQEVERTVEVASKTRHELLFAPLPDLEQSSDTVETDYSYMFGTDEEFENHFKKIESEKPDTDEENLKKRATVTDESVSSAKLELISLSGKDEVLDGILEEFSAETGLRSLNDMVKQIRINPELRLKVGNRILEIVEKYPYSIRSGIDQKKSSYPGYEKMPADMTSKEYVAVLILSMLDGTFKNNPSDPIVKDNYGEVKLGKHRNVANSIIRNFESYSR